MIESLLLTANVYYYDQIFSHRMRETKKQSSIMVASLSATGTEIQAGTSCESEMIRVFPMDLLLQEVSAVC